MVKNSRNFKKLLCSFLIMCLATSMLLTASFASSEGSDTSTLSPLQKVIEKVLLLSPEKRGSFVNDVLDESIDFSKRKENAHELLSVILPEDIDTALTEYDKLTEGKGLLKTFIINGIPNTINNTGFGNIARKINDLVNDKPDDPNNFGMRLTWALLNSASTLVGGPVVFDNTNVKEIKFKYNGPFIGSFNKLIPYVGTLNAKGIDSFDKLLTKAEGVINNCVKDPAQKELEITNFKLCLNEVGQIAPRKIYGGTLKPTPTPTPPPYNPPQSNSSPASTPTPTSTAIPTPTITPTITPTPTAEIKSSDKQITSFSFKGIKPEANGAIFEKTHTIIVKVPMETDLKGLIPTIEYKGDSVKPESGEKKNFTNPVFYTVTAKDKSKVRYVVIVVRASNIEVIDPNEYPSVPGRDIFGHWAEDHLIGLIENGIITGYPDGSIKPDTHMTRAEVVTLIVKSLGLSPAKDAKFNFKDSKNIPSWAQGYFKTALDKGFIKGYPNNTLKPMEKVTRAEFTVMVMNAFGFDISKKADVRFNDAKDGIPDWAKQHVLSAVNLKIISGYGDNTFKPNNFITRAEVGTIVDRCFGASGKSYPEL